MRQKYISGERSEANIFRRAASGVTESLFGGWGGGKGGGGADLHLGGPKGRHRNDFFPITFILHNQKSNGGGGGA